MRLDQIIKKFEKKIPLELAESWDFSGLNLGHPQQEITKVLFSLDFSAAVFEFAKKEGCELIVSHHPLGLGPIQTLNFSDYRASLIQKAIQNNLCLYASHTNHDASLFSASRYYAKKLKLKRIKPLIAHPKWPRLGCGVIGELPKEQEKQVFLEEVKKLFQITNLKRVENPKRQSIKRVAFLNGSGEKYWRSALEQKACIYITGDIRYHEAQEAQMMGLDLIDVGHFQSEVICQELLLNLFCDLFGDQLEYREYPLVNQLDPFC